MKKAILITLVLALPIFAQTSNRRRTKRSVDQKFTSVCGVSQTIKDFVEETSVEWRPVTTSSGQIYYYNTQKVVCSASSKTLKVWMKITRDNENHSVQRIELNCFSDQMRILSYTDYDKQGAVVKSNTFKAPTWDDVVPDSVGESTLEAVCHKSL